MGEANFGSRGASVNLELELDSCLAGEPRWLHDRIRQLFRLAKDSVDEGLTAAGRFLLPSMALATVVTATATMAMGPSIIRGWLRNCRSEPYMPLPAGSISIFPGVCRVGSVWGGRRIYRCHRPVS